MPQVTLHRITEHSDQETDYDTAVDITVYHIDERHYHLTIDGVDCKLIAQQTTWESMYYEANEVTGNYGPDLTVSDEPVEVCYKQYFSVGTEFDEGACSELIKNTMFPEHVKNDHINRHEFVAAVKKLAINEPTMMVVPNSLYKKLSHFRFRQTLMSIYEKYIPGFDRYAEFR